MTLTPMCHFLLVYDHTEQCLIREQRFVDASAATEAYAVAEREARTNDMAHLEIVLVGADTIETIRQTHAAYFDGSVSASKYLVGT